VARPPRHRPTRQHLDLHGFTLTVNSPARRGSSKACQWHGRRSQHADVIIGVAQKRQPLTPPPHAAHAPGQIESYSSKCLLASRGQQSVSWAARSPKCSQYFLQVALTFVLILNVPSAGGTVPPDLLPTGLRFLSNVLPLAQGVKITRSVVYFDGAELLGPTLILVGWAFVALTALVDSSKKDTPTKKNSPSDDARSGGVTAADLLRVPSAVLYSGGSAA
jgi:hypothetical protein